MTLKFIWHFAKKEKLFWAWLILLAFLNIVTLLEPIALKNLVEIITKYNINTSNNNILINSCLIYLSIALVPRIFAYHQAKLSSEAFGKISIKISSFLYRKTLLKKINFILDSGSGNISHKINNTYQSTTDILTTGIKDIALSIIMFAGYLAIIFYQSLIIGYIFVIISVLYLMLYSYFSPEMKRKAKIYTAKKDNLFNYVVDSLGNIILLKSFYNRNITKYYDKHSEVLLKAGISSGHTWGILHTIQTTTYWVFYSIIIITSAFLVFNNKMEIPEFVVILSLIGIINGYLQDIFDSVREYINIHSRIENTLELLLTKEDMCNLNVINTDGQPSFTYKKGDININNISFAYHKKDHEYIFEELNLNISEGSVVAIVGKSGSGKSTLINLLQRFYEIEKGSITIGNKDISIYNEDSVRKHITYIPQDTSLFSMSIFDNIAFANPNATKDKILEASKLANAHEFIEKLPKKYNQMVGERGFRLSGGQKQRIAIARAILKDSPIVLMDEATSALDSHSETLIQESLNRLLKNKTCIIIAHRLSTIKSADRILVMDKGKIIQDGSHDKLLKEKGMYNRLWNLQQDGFIS